MSYIVFHDKSIKQISPEQADRLMERSGSGATGILIDNCWINFRSISKILTDSEFYNQYPEHRPPETADPHKDIGYLLPGGDQLSRILSPIESKAKRIRAIEQMIKGLKKYINSPRYQGTDKPIKLLAHMEERLEQVKNQAYE